jgi:hypothetical protein
VKRDAGTRTALIVGPALTGIGIAWTAIAPSNASSAAVLTGLVTCIVGTHLFGRQGPEKSAERAVADAESSDDAASDDP